MGWTRTTGANRGALKSRRIPSKNGRPSSAGGVKSIIDAAYDGVNLQISVDGGKTWQVVELTEGYPALAFGDGCMKNEPFFSGVGPLMKHYNADLSAFAGRTGQLRFHWSSDPLLEVPDGGAWVDNVVTKDVVVSVPSAICP